ncbi:hypothetical protein SAMN02745248_02123 [Hathewaya proteolytica DSM 3090]|uniref:Uncharacterized protein n=1 Tax=Hathewaya proteolytica DSM 3090 TaxID=1121331 RepID=A0A1M6QTQ2_9CLOT|nr:glycosyltransferase [Hathewaya proteolytica]SHK23689.1 hypothetical protein SAMN02745248_02123 [Hathewaya proteolytica DSM 3090]
MKVLVISHMYPSSANEMSGIFVKKQVQELKKMGCDITVICPIPWAGFPLNIISNKWKAYDNIPHKEVAEGIEVHYPRYIEYPKGIAFASSGERIYNAIKKLVHNLHKTKKFDLIHCHVALPDGYAGMRLSKELQLPFMVTVHGQDFQYTIKKSEILKKKVYEVLNKADKIIVVSSKLRNTISDEKFISKTHIVFNGIDVNNEGEDVEKLKHIPRDVHILSASNLVETKGIKYNIMAVKELKKTYDNIKYYIIGSGNQGQQLEEMVKELDLYNNVIFLGRLSHEEVLRWMKKCSVFSLPSYQEGFGVVYIEAMLQGKPVIGIKGQGIQDAIIHGENGFLVKPKESQDLLETLQLLLSHEELRDTIGNNARKTVIEKFTWKKTAEELLRIYESLKA